MNPVRVYIDTCVFGGIYDPEFEIATTLFFDQVRAGRFRLVISALTRQEIEDAPDPVRGLLEEMLPFSESVYPADEALQLQSAYLNAGILTPKWAEDALHVAMATMAQCDLIVSWNFRHIVHFMKIPRYNAVNTLHGYKAIAIHTPAEVLTYEE